MKSDNDVTKIKRVTFFLRHSVHTAIQSPKCCIFELVEMESSGRELGCWHQHLL